MTGEKRREGSIISQDKKRAAVRPVKRVLNPTNRISTFSKFFSFLRKNFEKVLTKVTSSKSSKPSIPSLCNY
jgi:hypothetical protein